MHQKKSEKQQEIGKASLVSSDFNNPHLFCSQFNHQSYLQSTAQISPDFPVQNKPNLTIRVPFSPTSPNPSPPPAATTTHCHKEPNLHHHKPSFFNNPRALLSTPHKRPIMMTHNSFSRFPTLSSFKNRRNHCERVERLARFLYFSCAACFAIPFDAQQLGLSSKSSKTVVWSIGSKPKWEKKANSGTWVQVYSNGDVYEGEFHKGKCSGSGVYYYYIKGRYEGDWIDGKYDGYGVETWAKGSRYRGQYRQGLRHGIGVYRFYTGDVYAGEWSNGHCHGCGVHTCADGSNYVGEFKWGVKHGLGHYHFRNGDVYLGEYFADRMHGFGVYQFGNGHRYEGAWHEGRRQGFGSYTFRNGEKQSGHWQNGVLDVHSTQSIYVGSPYAVTQSRVHNAVQEAQRAAEKAYGIAKIDERVNKAVAAANKAANASRVVAVKAVQKQMHQHNTDDMDPPAAIV